MSAEIHPFACARVHPQRGEAVLCKRQTAHAGNHRGNDGERLLEWADLGMAPAEAPALELIDFPLDPSPAAEILVRWDPWLLLGWVLTILAVLVGPAVVIGAYQLAL